MTELAPTPSQRRTLLHAGLGLGVAVGAGVVLSDGDAHAATLPPVRPYSATPLSPPFARHMMNRMGCGFTPALLGQVRAAGGALAWFDKQLHPGSVTESALAAAVPTWFPDRADGAKTKWNAQISGSKGGWEYARDLGNLTMLRRIYSHRTVLETMADFWSNHLHVPAIDDTAWVYRYSYDQLLRQHALGRFDALLEAATLHPAMLLYLDTWRSEKGAPNENHGRELLELHTVGRTAGYTEDMVKDSAKILSGWTVDAYNSWVPRYDPAKHTTGTVRVLGFSAANTSDNGADLTKRYLHYLAHHPATARMVARRLAVRFVSDSPSSTLVSHLAQVFTSSGTDIAATLRALVRHPEFAASAGKKVRAPIDDFVASARVLGVRASKPANLDAFANALVWAQQGPTPFSWPRPDGAPEGNDAWSSAGRMIGSFSMHWNLGGGWWPSGNATYRTPKSWLPQTRIRFDSYVDHLSRVLLGRGSTPRLLLAACQAVGVTPGTIVTADHAIVQWETPRLLAVFLDSPAHLSR